MSDTLEKLEVALKDQPRNPLRSNQVKETREEAERLRQIVTAPVYVSADRGAANRRYQQVNKMIVDQSPKPLGTAQDAVSTLSREVLNDEIRPAMLTIEEMRRNPAGAVGQFLKRENSPYVKRAVNAWKRAQLALEPETDDPDHASIERFRPEKGVGGTQGFMGDAQIPGHIAMSPQAKENWPLGEPTADTAIAQVKQRERREMTAEQKAAASERLKGARARLAEKRATARTEPITPGG